MIGGSQRYRELMAELLLLRALAEGALPTGDEARFADALDRCWRWMSDAEQEEIERFLAIHAHPAGAPIELAAVDSMVERGDAAPPRRKAA